jgi:hypothetical protein
MSSAKPAKLNFFKTSASAPHLPLSYPQPTHPHPHLTLSIFCRTSSLPSLCLLIFNFELECHCHRNNQSKFTFHEHSELHPYAVVFLNPSGYSNSNTHSSADSLPTLKNFPASAAENSAAEEKLRSVVSSLF